MRKVVLFIAMSLDGYIADVRGKVDWLAGQDAAGDSGDSYAAFEQEVDTVIMGWTTYHQVVTELSPEKWVYENMKSYVITHREPPPVDGVTFTANSPCDLVNELKNQDGKDIWICGGANIVHQLMGEDLIDRYHISVIPTLLGGGVRLFDTMGQEIKLRLISEKSGNGIAELVYERRSAHMGR